MITIKVSIKLNKLLSEKNISHREFARMTGVRHPSISEMCNNETKRLPLDNLAKICEVLECDITDVLQLEKDPSE
ncbi:helix-turn-helix transcriptional regulator [Gracilibacillus sp. YIM 98692]|uniref:helix-turn-helix domain-containing protein n=1 Tax=Gracilibacillus sp. YIM 98692 TaxID=2663532 RepID=UPI0023E4059A|nr:helix-turn-helix transcriptional regulator [Gracilibacillus sp. YIM 98692]